MKLGFLRRGGTHYRLADPEWEDPLDGSWAQARGGRWNPPGSFPVVYLNATIAVARANFEERQRGQPWTPEELATGGGPDLVVTEVAEERFVDLVTPEGCRKAGLPESYPRYGNNVRVGWERCQPVGREAWERGAFGIACRSAARSAPPGGEELAWFARAEKRERKLPLVERRRFEEWYWGGGPGEASEASPPRRGGAARRG